MDFGLSLLLLSGRPWSRWQENAGQDEEKNRQ
jgi:hypothetical protein